MYPRQTRDTVNYRELINMLLELMGDELIQFGVGGGGGGGGNHKCTADEQFRLANSK